MTFDSGFWTRVLAEKGLESPGRKEAVEATLNHIRQKKEKIEEERKQKQKKKSRK